MLKKNHSTITIICIALLIPIIPFIIIGELPGESWLSSTDDNSFLFGFSGALLLTSDILLPIPSTIIGTMLGARLGFFVGFLWCWGGLVLGNLLGYFAGKLVLKPFSSSFKNAPTLLILAITRPIPVISEAVTFAAGAGGIKLFPFLFISTFSNAVFAAALSRNGASFFPNDSIGVGLLLPMTLPVASWLIWQYKFNK
mgnify:CR=1 FL=1